MLLNPFFGFAGDAPLPEGVGQAVAPVDGSPFQEILQGVQLADGGEQSALSTESGRSGYPSLAQVIAEAIAAEDSQGSTGTSQHPGLERQSSGPPLQGQTIQVQTDPELPIEPGLPNGVTRVASRQQVLPDAHGGSPNHPETGPAVHPAPTQTELPFTEEVVATVSGQPPNTAVDPPQPQTNTFASDLETEQHLFGTGQGERDDSTVVPPSGEQVRDEQHVTRNPETSLSERDVPQARTPDTVSPPFEGAEEPDTSGRPTERADLEPQQRVVHRGDSPALREAMEESSSETPVVREYVHRASGSRPDSVSPGDVDSTEEHTVDRSRIGGYVGDRSQVEERHVDRGLVDRRTVDRNPIDERPAGRDPEAVRPTGRPASSVETPAQNRVSPEDADNVVPSPRQQSLFDAAQLAELEDRPYASHERPQHEGPSTQMQADDAPSIPIGERELIEQGTPQRIVREPQVSNPTREGEVEQVPAGTPPQEQRPELTENAARIDAALRRLDSTTLARDVAIALNAQTSTSETSEEVNPRVSDLLRSMDGVHERFGASRRDPAPNSNQTVEGGSTPEGRQAVSGQPTSERVRETPGRTTHEPTIDVDGVDSRVGASRDAVRAGRESEDQDALPRVARQSDAVPTLRDAVRRTTQDTPIRDDVQVEQSAVRSASRDRTPVLVDRGAILSGESDVPLQDLLPTGRPEAQQFMSSTPSTPEPGLAPSFGVVSGGHDSIPAVETVADHQSNVPTEVEETKVTQQIVRGARFLTREGANQVTLRLDPPELGEVTIRLSSVDKTLSGEIRVESRMVQEIVNRNMADLRESLGSQGIHVDSIEVTVESGGRSGVDRDGGSAFRRETADRDGQPASDRDRQSRERDEQEDRTPRQPLEDGRFDAVA